MGSLVILYENFGDSGTYSGGNWLAQLPIANVQNADIHKVARSANATQAATKFQLDLGLDQPIDGLAFGPSNISPGATWRLRGYSDPFVTVVYDSGVLATAGTAVNWADVASWFEWEDPGFWLGVQIGSVDELLPNFNFVVVPMTAVLARFWQLEVFDTSNADGFIDIGRVLIGRAFRPEFNYGEDNQITIAPLTDVNEALGGARTYWERGFRRGFRAAIPNISETQAFRDVLAMSIVSGISRQIFVVPDPDDHIFYQRRAFLATFKDPPAITQMLIDRATTAIDVEEVL